MFSTARDRYRLCLQQLEHIVEALDAPGGLNGVVLDVTDPEPLPDGHPLYTHPKAIITAHSAGDFKGYFTIVADLFLTNVKRIRQGDQPFNLVDPEKGY